MKPFFLNSVPERIIMNISDENDHLSKIMRSLGVTYSHIVKIVHILEKEKIITKEKEGRKVKVRLTKKGEEIQRHLKSIREIL